MSAKKKTLALLTLTLLITTTITGLLIAQTATANLGSMFPTYPEWPHYPTITITNSGNISPQTHLISRDGNTYKLTNNVTDHRISIECSDIVFDGDGYTINLWNETAAGLYVSYGNFGVSNVTIKDVKIICHTLTIGLYRCSHCQITNVTVNGPIELSGMSNYNNISQCVGSIWLPGGSYNQIFKNNITELLIKDDANVFYENNFLSNDYNSSLADCFWDNGSVGNYWVSYNGTDANGDGVGDTPYFLEGANIVDHYPLMNPYEIEQNQEPANALFPIAYAAVVSAALVCAVAVCVGLVVYFKRLRGPKQPEA